jgi:hypothetical protein
MKINMAFYRFQSLNFFRSICCIAIIIMNSKILMGITTAHLNREDPRWEKNILQDPWHAPSFILFFFFLGTVFILKIRVFFTPPI